MAGAVFGDACVGVGEPVWSGVPGRFGVGPAVCCAHVFRLVGGRNAACGSSSTPPSTSRTAPSTSSSVPCRVTSLSNHVTSCHILSRHPFSYCASRPSCHVLSRRRISHSVMRHVISWRRLVGLLPSDIAWCEGPACEDAPEQKQRASGKSVRRRKRARSACLCSVVL